MATNKDDRPRPALFDDLGVDLAPPTSDRRPAAVPIEDNLSSPAALRLAFLGTGQGGGRIADAFWKLGYGRVGIFNTNPPDADGLDPEIPRLFVDRGGSAKDIVAARECLKGRDEEIRELLERAWGVDVEHGLICATLGGGTGSGTAALLAAIASAYTRTPVGALVALPAEPGLEASNARMALAELLATKVTPILMIDNVRVNALYEPSMLNLFPLANKMAVQLLTRFNQLSALRGPDVITTFDKSELMRLFNAGVATAAALDVDGTPSASTAIREKLASSVLARLDPATATEAACVFVGSPKVFDKLPAAYFDAAFDVFGRIAPRATLHRGVYVYRDCKGLQCYVMLSGLDATPLTGGKS